MCDGGVRKDVCEGVRMCVTVCEEGLCEGVRIRGCEGV